MSVTLTYDATSVTIQNPDVQNVVAIEKAQCVRQSAAGDRYRYDRGVERMLMRLRWSQLRDSEKADLQSFFEDAADGVVNQFVYTDHRGESWDAYFASPAISFVEVADSQSGAASTFASGGVNYPTTTRTAGVWAIDVTLEVSVPA